MRQQPDARTAREQRREERGREGEGGGESEREGECCREEEKEGRKRRTEEDNDKRERKGGTGSCRVGLGCRRVRGSRRAGTGGGAEGRAEENWNPE